MKSYRPYSGKRRKSGIKQILTVILAVILVGVVCFAVSLGVVLGGSRDDVKGEPQTMIILGCQVHSWGPSVTLQDRLNEALIWLEDHPDTTVVVTGGKGTDELLSEAQAMANYLMEHGFPEERILLEDRATNTKENLIYSKELLQLEEGEDVILVSNGFHLARARMLWHRLGGERGDLSTLAAPMSHRPSMIKMHLREPLALLKSFLLDWGA